VPEAERFAGILTALADGTPVDWASVESGAATDEERAFVGRLRRIEQVASLQRQAPPPVATWNHLRLVEKIGEGAFGEVYRAHDPRLARDVALKLLHEPALAGGRRASAVIEEGRLLARVRHPNVVTVYGAECLKGQVGIWTEFIDGQTLHTIVSERGPLAVEDVVSIGIDLCRALAAVHGADLLHRDIKAQNVMREAGGRIVLMDFGAGRDVVTAAGNGDVAGTPLYLAPELFTGGEASAASDVYSLGVLLFFLLTGKFPVSGRTVKEVQAAHREGRRVPLRPLRSELPAALFEAIERCLSFDPRRRFASAQEFEQALQLNSAAPIQSRIVVQQTTVRRPLGVALTLVIIALAGWALLRTGRTDRAAGTINQQEWAGPLVRTEGTVSADGRLLSTIDENGLDLAVRDLQTRQTRRLTWDGSFGHHASQSAISRDGTQIAYSWSDDESGREELRVRRIDAARGSISLTLPESPDVRWLMPYDWSHDGRDIAVAAGRADGTIHIETVSASTGGWTELAPANWSGPSRMSFSPDDRVLAFDLCARNGPQRDVFVVDRQTQKVTTVVTDPGNDMVAGWSPDGAALLFISDRSNGAGVWKIPMSGGAAVNPARLIQDLSPRSVSLGLTAAGTLVYGVGRSSLNVFTAKIDFENGRLLSAPQEVVEPYLLSNTGPDWVMDWASGDPGRGLVFRSDQPNGGPVLSLVTMDNSHRTRIMQPLLTDFQRPRWAPDNFITVKGRVPGGGWKIYRVEVPSGETTPLVPCDGPGMQCDEATWTPRDSRLVYRRLTPEGVAIVVRNMSSGAETVLASVDGHVSPYTLSGVSVSLDNSRVAYLEGGKGPMRVMVVPLDGGSPRELYTAPPSFVFRFFTEWTPDSRFVVTSIVPGTAATGKLISIPVAGGAPIEIRDFQPKLGLNTMRISRDGLVTFSMGQQTNEVWTLANFLSDVPEKQH